MVSWLRKRIAGPSPWGVNRTVLALSTARFADAIGNSVLIIVLPLYVAEIPAPLLDLPVPALVGILIALFGIVGGVVQPLVGRVADRTGRYKLFVQLGLLLMGAGILSYLLARRFSDLVLIRAVQGVGFALTLPTSMALMSLATGRDTRGGSMGIYTTFRMLGFALGPLLGGFLYTRYGFEPAFYAATGLVALGMISVQIWVEDPSAVPNPAGEESDEEAGTEESVGFWRGLFDWEDVDPSIAGLTAAAFMMASSFAIVSPLENEFNARLDQTALGFGVAFSALIVSRLLLQYPCGRLSDRMGRKPFVIGGLLLMVPATALLGLVTTTAQFVGLRVLQGAASAGIAAPGYALAADLSRPGSEGEQMSLMTAGFSLGIAAGPLLAGFLASWIFAVPFYLGGAGCLGAAWLVYRQVPETAVPSGQSTTRAPSTGSTR